MCAAYVSAGLIFHSVKYAYMYGTYVVPQVCVCTCMCEHVCICNIFANWGKDVKMVVH